jgi:hypothetical protein
MSGSISAGSQPVHIPNLRAPSSNATSPAATGSTTGSVAAPTSQQLATLKQLMAKYTYDVSHGVDATTLSNLGKQVMAAAQAAGQHVRLPSGSSASAPPSKAPEAGKLDVKA